MFSEHSPVCFQLLDDAKIYFSIFSPTTDTGCKVDAASHSIVLKLRPQIASLQLAACPILAPLFLFSACMCKNSWGPPLMSSSGSPFWWDFCVCDSFSLFSFCCLFLIQPQSLSHSVFMDGVCWVCFCLPAFTRLGHECQDLLSPCDGMHVCTD